MDQHSNTISRRTALKSGVAGIIAAGGFSSLSSVDAAVGDQNYGEPPTSTSSRGPNYGGLDGYDDVVHEDEADYIVESITELEDALDAAEYGDVVYVPGDAEIDTGTRTLTSRGPPGLHVPEGVTLASNRGVDGSRGGLIYTDSSADGWPTENWVMAAHSDSRVTGLRIRGKYWDAEEVVGTRYGKGLLLWDGDWYADPGTTTNVEVDNCEFAGWSSGCVTQYRGADDCRVHHCDFHDTLIAGLGYGVSVSRGYCQIDHNTFNRNRHAIASSGNPNASYDAHHNVFGDYTISHVIDVHRPGGDRFNIHHNTVRASHYYADPETETVPAVAIRGVPDDGAWIHNNWFYNPKEPRDRPRQEPNGWSQESIIQVYTDDWNNVDWKHNHLGEDEPKRGGIGAPHSEKVQW